MKKGIFGLELVEILAKISPVCQMLVLFAFTRTRQNSSEWLGWADDSVGLESGGQG